MLKKIVPFILIAFCLHCKPKNEINNSVIGQVPDSVIFYYELSKDESVPTDKRYKAINKSLSVLREAKNDTIYNHILYQKNLLHLYLSEYDSLLIYSNHLINRALETSDNFILARQYYLMGYYFGETSGNNDKAFQNYTLSKTHFEKINDSSWVGRNLMNMATIQKNQNDFFGSKETLTEALRYLEPQKDKKHIANCYNALATNHRKLLNYQDAEKYYGKAIEITEAGEEDRLIYQNNLAATYIDDKQYYKAIGILSVLSQDSVLISNQKEYARVMDNLAFTMWLSGKKVNEEAFLNPLQIRKRDNDKRGQIASHTHLGEFHSQKNPNMAKAHFDTVIQFSRSLKIPRAEKDALAFLMELEPNNVQIRNRYVFLQDSLYAQELKVKTQFAKYKYDDKLKQESILRLEKENAEKELEASRQRNQKLMSSAIGGLLLLVLGFFSYYFVQRTKQLQKEKKIAVLKATHETEAELSRKLHDDFGGKLNRAMVMLQSNAPASEVLDVVDGLYNQSRNFSREINAVDTGPNFKNELFEMLRFRTPADTKLLLTGANDMDWGNISPISKTTLFRVLQELMINMGKHSKATLISIEFITTLKIVKIDYADDGVGASPKDLLSKNGLRNTEKRIRAIEGSITFDSEKGKGFRAQLEIPK